MVTNAHGVRAPVPAVTSIDHPLAAVASGGGLHARSLHPPCGTVRPSHRPARPDLLSGPLEIP